jgi:tetratricopeptide (TPR) repeat protein
LASCSDPAVAKKKYYEKANTYFLNKQYHEATLEYRNALKIDPLFGDARLKLAQAYELSGDTRNAYREYIRAADLLTADADVQLTAARYLLAAGQFTDAAARAKKAIALAPSNSAAHVLLGAATAGTKDSEGAMKEIEEAIQLDPANATAYASRATLLLQKGQKEEAEKSFRKAIEVDPKSVPVRLALADFLIATGGVNQAEQVLKDALQIEPTNPLANRALAVLYLGTNRPVQAEPYAKAYVANVQSSAAKFWLADYYIAVKKYDAASDILTPLTTDSKTPVADAAGVQLARLEYASGKRDSARARVDAVLRHSPSNVDALVAKGTWLLVDHKLDDALKAAETATKADPTSIRALYLLGTTQGELGNIEGAKASFAELIKRNPRAGAAQAALARLNLGGGDTKRAVAFASDAVGNAPRVAEPRLLLVRGLLAQRELDRADLELKPLLQNFGDDATVISLHGTLLWLRHDSSGAKREYERALQRDPHNVDALAGIVTIDSAAGQLEQGRRRIAAELDRSPNDSRLHLLAATGDIEARDFASGERNLRRTIELDPGSFKAYELLGRMYVQQKKLDEAKEQFQALAVKQPQSVPAHTMIGMILQAQHRDDDAIPSYERALKIDPSAPVAANNLAWLYAERGVRLEEALALARAAADRLPDNAEIRDTLGYVHFRRKDPAKAITEFQRCVSKDPKNALFQYHLGIALAATGDRIQARRALEEALRLNPAFDGAAEARQTLESLKG